MAVILIDSCIITDLADQESDWFEWSAGTLERLEYNNTMIINPIIYTECSIGYRRIEEVEALFEHLGFAIKAIPKEALFLAGKAFLQYKKQGNVLPDFFIGAHAAVSGY
ncbi:MAG: type II toxin-antitoxin system VapC family toxin, partial [Methylobacter sp.]